VDEWRNVVTACSSCNHHKDDRLVAEVGPGPLWRPWVPSRQELVLRRLEREIAVA
jgi:5-methylcytosine-specific restriction endonuclease McrA